jgi:hypothetical protein
MRTYISAREGQADRMVGASSTKSHLSTCWTKSIKIRDSRPDGGKVLSQHASCCLVWICNDRKLTVETGHHVPVVPALFALDHGRRFLCRKERLSPAFCASLIISAWPVISLSLAQLSSARHSIHGPVSTADRSLNLTPNTRTHTSAKFIAFKRGHNE